jgi:cation-transporting ATPase E
MVAILIGVFAAVLFIPALSNYFGLTGPAEPVFALVLAALVLPALVLWFATLTMVFRFRLVERVLGGG